MHQEARDGERVGRRLDVGMCVCLSVCVGALYQETRDGESVRRRLDVGMCVCVCVCELCIKRHSMVIGFGGDWIKVCVCLSVCV